jgi:putative zinc finger/helix-turn-helix YgiT family protein
VENLGVTKCLQCGIAMKTRRENYRYIASGLPSVTLQDVEVSRCPTCGETDVVIPAIEELHRAIAGALIRKRARLAAPEIRFLRKVLGWSGVDFARHMGATPETVSRWERGHAPIGAAADRLLRLLVARQAPVDDYRVDILAELAVDDRTAKPVRLGLSPDARAGWRARPDTDLVPT